MTAAETSTQQEFQSETLKLVVHRKGACKVEFLAHAQRELVQRAKTNAVKSVGKEVSLPGFRKGKAPEEMILRKFGSQVEKETHNKLADIAYLEAQKLARIPLLNNNSRITFDMKSFADTGADLLFQFETEPSIPAVDPAQFHPKEVKKFEVGEKEIGESVRQMMFFYAEWKPVEDRPIQDGDFIMIDLDTVEGESSQRVFNHIRFEVTKERMANWMKKLVEGAKAGDVLDGVSEADDTLTEEERAEFQPKKVRISIIKVEQPILPELNDEFAKKVGAENVEAMRKSVAQILTSKAEEKAQSELREQVNDFLVKNYEFELPHSIVEAEKKHRMHQLFSDPKSKANWEKMSEEERKKHLEKVEHEAAQAVRLFYLSRNMVQQAKVPVTHKEIQDEAIATMRSFGAHNAKEIPKEVFALAMSKVLLAKAQDLVLNGMQKA